MARHSDAQEKKLLFIGVVIVGAILVTIFWTKSAKVMVTGHRWERSIEIQAYQAIEEGSWCNQVPAEAYDMRQEQRQRGTTQVRDGEDCSDMNVDNRDGRSDAVNLATDPSRLTTPTATIPSIGGSTRAGSTTKGNDGSRSLLAPAIGCGL
jgi:hypothetical protein